MTDAMQQPAQDDTGHRETASGIGAPNVEPAGARVVNAARAKVSTRSTTYRLRSGVMMCGVAGGPTTAVRITWATSCSLPNDSTVGASTPATDAPADVPHETPEISP